MDQRKETVSIPMTPFQHHEEPSVPSYAPSYQPQSHAPEPYNPVKYSPDPYLSGPSAPSAPYTPLDPYAPSGDCCGDCPSPPPYSCQDVPCDRVGPVCMSNNPPVVVAGIFCSKPASTICPCCRQIITTDIVFRVGPLTYAACTAICVMGGCMGCFLIPFMTKCCKDVDHYCPCCRYHIYRYKRI
ncbi:lipopolysaccharide-induced tumor necrosis factor-alpha factor homolog [Pogona vitticeps]